jgi:hypothetical protein
VRGGPRPCLREILGRAMSQEFVELSRLPNDAWIRRDAEAAVALWHPEGVWASPAEGDHGGTHVPGHAGMRQYLEDVSPFARVETAWGLVISLRVRRR